MGDLGIKPELEVYDTGHLDVALTLRQEGLLADPLQFAIVLGVRGRGRRNAGKSDLDGAPSPQRRDLAGDRYRS